MIPDRFDATARAILDAIHRNPGIAGEPDLHTRIAEALREADKVGAICALEMAAEDIIKEWPGNLTYQNMAARLCKIVDELRGEK